MNKSSIFKIDSTSYLYNGIPEMEFTFLFELKATILNSVNSALSLMLMPFQK